MVFSIEIGRGFTVENSQKNKIKFRFECFMKINGYFTVSYVTNRINNCSGCSFV